MLRVSIFDTILSLLCLYTLGDTQTRQFNLRLDVLKDFLGGTSSGELDILLQELTEKETMMAHLKKTMEPDISRFKLLGPTNMAFSAWVVPISTNVTAYLALHWIIAWATIDVDLKPYLCS